MPDVTSVNMNDIEELWKQLKAFQRGASLSLLKFLHFKIIKRGNIGFEGDSWLRSGIRESVHSYKCEHVKQFEVPYLSV